MGMGEPLLNYEATARALQIAMDPDGLAFAARKITLSTSGVVPKIETLGRELGVGLAISLHAVRDELRDELVPINRKMATLRSYSMPAAPIPPADRITFEYVMLDRRQRQRRRRARAGPPDPRHPRQGQPDPVQPVARRALPLLVAGADPGVRRDRDAGRLRLAGAHAARPRHPGRLRPAQDRQRAPAREPASRGVPLARILKRILVGVLAMIGALTVLLLIGVAAFVWLMLPSRPSLPERMVLTLDLREGLEEVTGSDPLAALAVGWQPSFTDVILALDQAGADARVAGLLVRLDGEGPGFAQLQELRDAVRRFRDQGKLAVAHADAFGEFGPGNRGYYLATAFERIDLQPIGTLGLTGLILETPLVRGLLDKLGVLPTGDHRGAYKTIYDTFAETAMTPAHRESLQSLVELARPADQGGPRRGPRPRAQKGRAS